MKNDRDVVRAYGRAFDSLFDLMGNAMTAFGYPSRHARPTRHQPDRAELRGLIVNLGMLCEKMETDLRGGSGLSSNRSPEPAGFLAVYASARRLILLFREAQASGTVAGRVAVELDFDIDEVEELLRRLDDPDEIVAALRALVTVSGEFQALLPAAIRDGVRELERLLGPPR
jgi:hypothetical protein